MGIKDRGFASMDRARQREIASAGGTAAHVAGTAHQWTTEEARAAGKLGGKRSAAARAGKPVATRSKGHAD
jgi:general stress protein YciG